MKKSASVRTLLCMAGAIAALSMTTARQARAQETTREVPTCNKLKSNGKRVRVLDLIYVLPRNAIVREFHDVDHGGYRVFAPHTDKPQILTLSWGVNSYPGTMENSSKTVRRLLTLPDGRKGIDASGVVSNDGREGAWRSTGVMGLFAYYRDVTPETAKYFDAIIDSVCFEKR